MPARLAPARRDPFNWRLQLAAALAPWFQAGSPW
jgi:hypothetical protein